MSKLGIYTEIDTNTFLQSAVGLKLNELEDLVHQLNHIIKQKKNNSVDVRELELLQLHNETVLSKLEQKLLKSLTKKLENRKIEKKEREILLKLTAKEESLRNERLKYLIELSQLRQVALPLLMKEMDLKS